MLLLFESPQKVSQETSFAIQAGDVQNPLSPGYQTRLTCTVHLVMSCFHTSMSKLAQIDHKHKSVHKEKNMYLFSRVMVIFCRSS